MDQSFLFNQSFHVFIQYLSKSRELPWLKEELSFLQRGNTTGLPHTQGNSGNFHVEENLRETQGILIYILNSGKFDYF